MTNQDFRYAIANAYEKALKTAKKNCDDYISYNPQDKKRREYLLDIEKAGINNLYYLILDEIKPV